MKELRVLSPTGAFGVTPFNQQAFEIGLGHDPQLIGVDAGSNDFGPFGLGSDIDIGMEDWERESLSILLSAALDRNIPLIIGSAGHAGTDKGVRHLVDLAKTIKVAEQLPDFKLAAIFSEVDKDWLADRVASAAVTSLEGAPEATQETIERSGHIVAMMGPEPISHALKAGADVVIAGRVVDEAIFSSKPILDGYPKGLSEHLGKVLECASLAGEPYMSRSSLLGTITESHLVFEPMHPDQICTPRSVAAHSLYERLDPYKQAGPGGWLDLSNTKYEQVTPRATSVAGSRWIPADRYTVKLEGAAWCGHRRLGIVAFRDRIAIENLDRIIEWIEGNVSQGFPTEEHDYELYFHAFGRNGVLEEFEPKVGSLPHEACLILEAVAKDEDLADSLIRLAVRQAFIARYPGQLATGGGAAMLADEVLPANDAYEWTFHHAVELGTPEEIFTVEMLDVE